MGLQDAVQIERLRSLSPEVGAYLRKDPVRNAFAYHYLTEEPDRSEFWVCRQHGHMSAHLLLYDTPEFGAVWANLGGDPVATTWLVPHLPENKVVVIAPPEQTDIVVRHLPGARVILEDIMGVERGGETLGETTEVVRVGPEHAEAYARLVLPPVVPISATLVERMRRHLTQETVDGVLRDGALVAVAGSSVRTPWTWVIGGVGTHPDHRRKGLARAVTSAVTREGLKATGRVGLWVASENEPARRLYRGLGYRKLGESSRIDIGADIEPETAPRSQERQVSAHRAGPCWTTSKKGLSRL